MSSSCGRPGRRQRSKANRKKKKDASASGHTMEGVERLKDGSKAMEVETSSSLMGKKNQPGGRKEGQKVAAAYMPSSRSAESFGRQVPSRRSFLDEDWDPVMITSNLSDVRERYHISPKELGHGHYGVVRKCMDRKTKQWYAIKSIRKSRVNKIEVLKREIDILKDVNHPNIIRLVEVHEDDKYLHLITDLCTGGELFDRIIAKTQSPEGHFSERDAAKLIHSILDAIQYCHDEKRIVHRDLKPENFLYATEADDSPIKIIDFGLSRPDVSPNSIMRTKVGTPYYVAPEVLRRKYTASCDIWSIGVICYILLCGYPPFYGESDTQIFDSVKAGYFDFPSPEWDSISDEAKDFICCLLKKEPTKRLTAAQAIQHKWIQLYAEGSSSTTKLRHGKRRSLVFKTYMGMSKLKKLTLGYIAANLTAAEIENLGEVFKSIDKEADGNMTLKELNQALTSQNFPPDLVAKLKATQDELSLSGDEVINWKDFLAAMMDKNLMLKEDKIIMALDRFKEAEDNCLDLSQLVSLLGGEHSTREILDIDKVGDRITIQEFKNMITSSFNDNVDINMFDEDFLMEEIE